MTVRTATILNTCFYFGFIFSLYLYAIFSLQVDLTKQRASITVLDCVIGASPTTRGTNMCVGRRFVFMSM